MTYWIDQKYLSLLSSLLPLYSVVSSNPFKASSRCPICGDSKKNPYKKRAHYYKHKEIILMKCFNCGATRSVKSLLKDLNPDLKREYDLEIFAENKTNQPIEPEVIKHEYLTPEANKPLKALKKISQLPVGHPAKVYVEKRMIPSKHHFRLYYVPNFFAWTNSIIPDKFKLDEPDFIDEPRLVLPFFDKDGNMFGYQGRAFDPKAKSRYITIMVRGDFTKVYGLDQFDFDKPGYIVEGPIDSFFLDNAIAMAGSDISFKFLDKDKTTVVFDNEPRNKEILKKINAAIENGYKVCIWPENLIQKDLNDMFMSGLNTKKLVDENTFQGPAAKLQFNYWKKVE